MKLNFKTPLKYLGAISGAALAFNAQALLIDDFDSVMQSVGAVGAPNTAAAPVIGGFRTVELTSIVGALGASATVLPAPSGFYAHSADVGTSATSQLTWDANGTGLGGADFTDAGLSTLFHLDILSIDVGLVDLTITVADTLSGVDSVTLSGLTVGQAAFDFASFSGIDFTSIDSVQLTVAGGIAADLSLDLFETSGDLNLPEPSAFLLMGLGLFGFSRRKSLK